MTVINGVIEAKTFKFDKHNILVAGNWYSSKYPFDGNKGDTVEFETPEGKKYVNKLRVVASGGSVSSSQPVSAGKATPSRAFPVPTSDHARSIIRQNAVTNANTFLANNGVSGKKAYTVNDLLDTARVIEEYTSGDLDLKRAKARVDGGFDPEE